MVSSEFWFGAEAGFYNGVATQSLRFDGTRATTLYRDIAQAGNRKIATYAFWLKFDATDTSFTVFSKGDGGGVQTSFDISIDSSRLRARFFESDSQTGLIRTNRLLRDSSAWYHIVVAIDVSQGTSSDRVKLYINGTQETSLESSSYPSDSNTVIGNNSAHTRERIGDSQMSYFPNTATGGSSSNRLNGYLCDFHHVDGQQLTPSSFGEFKNGVWIAKDYTGNHGDNGFRLEFKQTGDGQSTASSSTIGADTGVDGSGSATNNHFKDQNFETYDSNMPDSPENNFCTLNPLEFQENNSGAFTAEGNLKWSNVNANINSTFGFGNQGGKYYWEYLYVSSTDGNQYQGLTLPKDGISLTNSFATGIALYFEDGTTRVDGVSGTGFAGKINADNIIQFKLDLDNGTLEFGKNNTYISALTLPTSLGGWRAGGIQAAGSGGTRVFVANYGQDSSFAGNKTAQGNTDANGIGDFYYAPPSGFLAVCSANLPEPTIGANSDTQADDHFNTVLYSGNGGTQSITGVGFQPDWVWIKERSSTSSHALYDSSRGALKQLESDGTGAESTASSMLTSFDSDGFSVGSSGAINQSSQTYVGWNWKANGTTPSKTYKVVVVSDSGNKYRFRNSADSATFAQSAVTLDLQELGTYVFDWSDSTAQGHPIRFSTTSDGTHGGGSEYTTGVVKDDSAYTTTITVASSAPTLYYYCQNHSGMGGQVNTNTTSGSTNFDGSILSVEQRNTTAGFSIVLYTGTGANVTIGHGASTAPQWIIIKRRDSAQNWVVYHEDVGNQRQTYLNLGDAQSGTNSVYFNNTSPTSTVFSLGSDSYANASSGTYVAYCFGEIEGYSKFGSYTGNGNNDGTFVYTGFRPAWVMVKKTSGSESWQLVDNVRDTENVVDKLIYPNSNSEEITTTLVDFVSNGFKNRASGGNMNDNGETYIYMAFAEQPFKYALGR